MLFRLKQRCGNHVENGKIYEPGDIIETGRDLSSKFRNKFERIHEALKDTGKKDTDEIKRPNIPPSVGEGGDTGLNPSPESSPISDEEIVEENLEYGEDVTSEFPTAEKLEVKVFEKSKWYTIVDTSDGEVLNEKKLRKKDVIPFLEQYLED